MESRLEKIFSMGINIMSLAVWLGEDRKCSEAVVGLDLLLGLSMVRRCSIYVDYSSRIIHVHSKHYVVMSFIARRLNTQSFGRYDIVSLTIIQG